MNEFITIRNNLSLTEIKTVKNIITPLVYEEINASYTFSFEVDYHHKGLFLGKNIIDVEGQYFRPTRIVTDRGYGVSVSVDCEHVSYDLIDEEDETEEYEDTAAGMISNVLSGTPFEVGSVIDTPSAYYKPSSKVVRQRLFDIANLFGTELIFDNFTVHLVYSRGTNNNQQFKLGENLVSVQEEIDNTTGMTAYDVDVVDLSKVPGYEFLMSIGLGDTVEVVDPLAGIYTTQRVLSRQYNPFTKINPRVQIGNLIRDFTDYIREKEEEKEEEEDPTANFLLEKFMIGTTNCLLLNGVELDYESVLPDDVTASVGYFVEGEHKGVTIALKSQYSKYIATVTKFYEDGSYIDYNLSGLSETLQTWNFPEKNLVALTVTVSPVPINEVDPDIHKAAIYAVTFNKTYIDPIREFKVGKNNVLKMNAVIDTDGDNLNIEEDITAVINYSLLEEHKGMKFSIKREFKDYFTYITLLDENGLPTPYEYEAIKDDIGSWNFPRDNAKYLLITVQEKSTGEFDAAIHRKVTYGVKFEYVPIEPLREFKIGDEDCLLLEGVMLDKEPALDDYLAEIFYNENEQYKGLKLSLSREFSSYHVSIKTISENSAATEYDLSTVQNQIINWSFPTENIMYVLITVSQASPEEFDPTVHRMAYYAVKFVEDETAPKSWLSEFRIGDEDCLILPGIMIDDADSELITAELTYTKNDDYKGLFLKLKEEYRGATIVVTDETGKTINYSDAIVLPNGIKKILVMLTIADEKQYYGIEFIKAEFVGLITIKSKDEEGNVISTNEKSYKETGIYEITAIEIKGYYLLSEKTVKVELSINEPEQIIEFIYKNLSGDDGPGGSNQYVMEFGTSVITSNMTFAFNREYTNIESVTLSVMSGTPAYMNMSWEPITNISGACIGVKVIVSPVVSGKSVSVQAICKR